MRHLKHALVAIPALLTLFYVIAFTSCTSLADHTVAPYDRDPRQAQWIEDDATRWCVDHRQPAGPPTVPFRFDGCSWWPDGSSRECCQRHDYAYWCGGSRERRKEADAELRRCVAEKTGSDAYGWLMEAGVRVGGHPVVPLYFRWGYGHGYSGSYPRAEARPTQPSER